MQMVRGSDGGVGGERRGGRRASAALNIVVLRLPQKFTPRKLLLTIFSAYAMLCYAMLCL